MKKEISIYCLRFFLKNQAEDIELGSVLCQLKQALNGGNGKQPRPELQFIRQLRSSLWIVRLIRGLLGGTSTQLEFNKLLEAKQKQIATSEPSSCFSAFFTTRNIKATQDENSLTIKSTSFRRGLAK